MAFRYLHLPILKCTTLTKTSRYLVQVTSRALLPEQCEQIPPCPDLTLQLYTHFSSISHRVSDLYQQLTNPVKQSHLCIAFNCQVLTCLNKSSHETRHCFVHMNSRTGYSYVGLASLHTYKQLFTYNTGEVSTAHRKHQRQMESRPDLSAIPEQLKGICIGIVGFSCPERIPKHQGTSSLAVKMLLYCFYTVPNVLHSY